MNGHVAIDWDGTLANADQECFDEANRFVRGFTRLGLEVVVFSCRAGWKEGRTQIEVGLKRANIKNVKVTDVKPPAFAYIDDRAVNCVGPADYERAFEEAIALVSR